MSSRDQKLRASITIGSVLEGSVKKNIGILKSGLHQVGQSIKEVEKRQKELAKQRKVLEAEGRSVAALDREYEALERQLKGLRRAQERWNGAAQASRRVGSTFRDMTTDIGRQVRRLTIGLGLAGGAVFGLASSTAALGDNVAKTADKLGIGIEALQELRYAAERSGVSTENFDTALEKMVRNLGEASQGTGTAKDALDQLGLSAEELIQLEPEEALGLIADRMGEVGTQAEQAAIAADIFGRSGVGMINMLRGGSRGLRQLRDDARRTGYVLSEKAARDAEVFQDTLLDTQLALKGVKNTVGAELLPVVTRAMRRLGDAVIANREEIQAWSEAFAGNVERALPIIGQVLDGMGEVGSAVGGLVGQTAELAGGWDNLGIAIGAALAANTMLKIVKFGVAIGRLVASVGTLVALSGPIGVALAAIAAGSLLIYRHWEDIERVVGRVTDKMREMSLIDVGARTAAGNAIPLQKVLPNGENVGQTGGMSRQSTDYPFSPYYKGDKRPFQFNGQARAAGGSYRPGWLLTGERGPELRYDSRGGYIAHNRAVKRMEDMGRKAMQAAPASAAATVINQTITINAQGASAAEVARELDRRSRLAASAALYDRAPAVGPYGR